jgi:hypothetical protein
MSDLYITLFYLEKATFANYTLPLLTPNANATPGVYVTRFSGHWAADICAFVHP